MASIYIPFRGALFGGVVRVLASYSKGHRFETQLGDFSLQKKNGALAVTKNREYSYMVWF